MPSVSSPRHLFHTHTLCPHCTFVERKGFTWRDARVVEEDGAVVLHASCPMHGPIRILYCSQEPFLARLASFAPGRAERSSVPTDIEDLTARFPFSPDTPLLVHIDIARHGTPRPAADIVATLRTATKDFPPYADYTVSLNCATIQDIPAINDRAAILRDTIPSRCPLLLALPPLPVSRLAQHHDSVLLRGGVYPSLRTHILPGEESAVLEEIVTACSHLRSIRGLQAVLTVTVNPPYANLRLHGLLTLIRQHQDLIRFLVFEAERSTQDVLASIQGKGRTPDTNTNTNNQTSCSPSDADTDIDSDMDMDMDILGPVDAIVDGSQGMLHRDDFYPVSAGMVLEPLLQVAGLGQFNIRPSPFCASGTAIWDDEDKDKDKGGSGVVQGTPLPRILDLHRVFERMLPVLRRIREHQQHQQQQQQQQHRNQTSPASNPSPLTLGWRHARTVKKAFSGSVQPGARMPTVLQDVLRGEGDGGEVMRRLQFVIVHHRMDVAMVESKRRARCTACEVQGDGSKVAACTHCL